MTQKKLDNYWQHSVTVDTVVFTIEENELKILLIKRRNEPFRGLPALAGGFLQPNERLEDAALRVLADKAGLQNVYLEQLYTFDEMFRDPRGPVISVGYFALTPRNSIVFKNDKQIEEPGLYSLKHLPKLAFDHQSIIAYALKRLRAKLEYTNIAYSLLPKQFTLSQLQKTYEIILGLKLDKRNFLKKYLSLGLIEQTDKFFSAGRQRPARLYHFTSKKIAELKRWF